MALISLVGLLLETCQRCDRLGVVLVLVLSVEERVSRCIRSFGVSIPARLAVVFLVISFFLTHDTNVHDGARQVGTVKKKKTKHNNPVNVRD